MLAQAQNQTIRILADETARSSVLDVNTNATPQCWARAATQFEIGLNSAGAFLDVSNLASVTLEGSLYSNRDGARLFSATLATAALDNTVTADTWAEGSSQNALFTFTSAQMNIALGGATSISVWIVISAITNAGAPIVFGAGTVAFIDPGTLFTADAPPANPGAYLTIDQAEAMFAPIAAAAEAASSLPVSPLTGLVGGGASNLDGQNVNTAPNVYPTNYAILLFTPAVTIARLELNTTPANGAQVIVPPDDANRSWRIRL